MTDYADLEKRLRARTVAVRGPAGVFTTVLSYQPDTLCEEAADALAFLTSRLTAVRAVIESGGQRLGMHKNPNNPVCEHNSADFEDCVACYDEFLIAALEGRDLSRAQPGQDDAP